MQREAFRNGALSVIGFPTLRCGDSHSAAPAGSTRGRKGRQGATGGGRGRQGEARDDTGRRGGAGPVRAPGGEARTRRASARVRSAWARGRVESAGGGGAPFGGAGTRQSTNSAEQARGVRAPGGAGPAGSWTASGRRHRASRCREGTRTVPYLRTAPSPGVRERTGDRGGTEARDDSAGAGSDSAGAGRPPLRGVSVRCHRGRGAAAHSRLNTASGPLDFPDPGPAPRATHSFSASRREHAFPIREFAVRRSVRRAATAGYSHG